MQYGSTWAIYIRKSGIGNFQFIPAQGKMDDHINDNPVAFTWNDFDENDEMSRGFAENAQNELQGNIYIHLGVDSTFRAVK